MDAEVIKVEPASRPFRWVLGTVLRRRRCTACDGSLEIVWIRTPVESGTFFDGSGVGYDNRPTESVSVGYRCAACRALTSWRGVALTGDTAVNGEG